MNGVLYGVGIGPGDPELLTLKAVRIIRNCDVVGIPAKDTASCTAWQIAIQAVPEMEQKEVIAVPVPMTKNQTILDAAYDAGALELAEALRAGKNIAFLNLGDPTVYGTYMELDRRIRNLGLPAELVSGVPSFCAVAAALGEPLGARKEAIHILPGSYEQELENLSGTKILMKSAGKTAEVKQMLVELQKKGGYRAMAVTNCSMESEIVCRDIEKLDENAGYFTTILVKED